MNAELVSLLLLWTCIGQACLLLLSERLSKAVAYMDEDGNHLGVIWFTVAMVALIGPPAWVRFSLISMSWPLDYLSARVQHLFPAVGKFFGHTDNIKLHSVRRRLLPYTDWDSI